MPTRTEVIQSLKSRDEFQNRDIATVLDYLEQEAGSSSSTRDAILDGKTRTKDAVTRRDLTAIYNYVAELGGTTSTLRNFLNDLVVKRDIVSLDLVNHILDLVDGTAFFAGPLPESIIHWYDFSNAATLFSDLEGTVPAVGAGQVRRVTDLGSRRNDILGVSGAGNPTLETGVVGGLNALEFAFEDGGLNVIDTVGLAAGTGVTFSSVWRRTVTVGTPTVLPAHVFHWADVASPGDPGEMRNSYDASGNGRPQFEADNISIIGPNPNIVDNQWEWFYHTSGAPLGMHRSNHSGPAVENSGVNVLFNVVPAGRIIRVGEALVQIAELVIHDVDMSVVNLGLLTGYFNTKYGALPF